MEEITVSGLAEAIEAGNIRLIDVREADEYRAGHVPTAEFITISTIPLRLADLPRDQKFHFICESGGRSWQVCSYLEMQGYQVVNVVGGTGAWRSSGRPLTQGMEA